MKSFYYTYLRHIRKNSHLAFYVRSFARFGVPKCLMRSLLPGKLREFDKLSAEEQEYIRQRVDYYCKLSQPATLPADAPTLGDFRYKGRETYDHQYVNSAYFFDAYEYTRYFPDSQHWAFVSGDVNTILPQPSITKSRPVTPDDGNRNNTLLNLDKTRHFMWASADPYAWEEKECRILFRGDTRGKPHREQFIAMWKDHPLCDLLNTGAMTIYDHLASRYIMALEGNDVASNLKWVMSSNSIAVMPRPKFETWYMEGRLIPNYHYIEIAPDYHDLIERIEYYEAHPEEAKAIIAHAHDWTEQFRHPKREDLISLLVLKKYFDTLKSEE